MQHEVTFNMTNLRSGTPLDRYEALKAHCASQTSGPEISDELWNEIADTIEQAIITPCQSLSDVVRKLTILLDLMDEADCKALALATSVSHELVFLINQIEHFVANQPSRLSTPAPNYPLIS